MPVLWVNGASTGLRVRHAERWHQRAIGLLGTRQLEDPVGLWLSPCNSVHMLGMRIPLDVVFLDRQGLVIKVVHALRPWQFAGCWAANGALELRAGLATQLGLAMRHRLTLAAES